MIASLKLQRPWVRVPAWGPLLRVVPPLSQPVSCHVFSYPFYKDQKNIYTHIKKKTLGTSYNTALLL